MKESFRERGGRWVIVQFVLMLITIAAGPLFQGDWFGRWPQILGGLLLILGAVTGIAGSLTLGRNRTPYPVPNTDTALIQDGIYAYIRHPLYTSLILLGLAWALFWHSGAALVASIIMALQLHFKAAFEERQLDRLFSDYPDYRKRVPRFFPRLRRRRRT